MRCKVQHLGLLMGENRQELAFEAESRMNSFLAGRPFLKSQSFQLMTEGGTSVGLKVRKLQLLLQGDHSAANIERNLGKCITPSSVRIDGQLLEKVHALVREWKSTFNEEDEHSLWDTLCVVQPSVTFRDRTGWFLTYNPTLNKVFDTRITSGVREHEDGGLPYVLTEIRDLESQSSFPSRIDEEDVDMYIANGHSEATARCATSCILCEVCSVATEFLVDAEDTGDVGAIKPPRPKDLKKLQLEHPALMCSSCSMVVHVDCLGVASKSSFTNRAILHHLSRSKADWFCPLCHGKKSRYLHYGYQTSDWMTRKEYEFRSSQVARKYKLHVSGHSVESIENIFWSALGEDSRGQVQVLYASDLDSMEFCQGPFPESYFENNSWELRNLALNKKSILSHLSGSENTKGVTRPWLYLGSHLSSFCWHAEDMYLCSISYLHQGAAKVWYTVPGNQRALLEQAMASMLPDLASANRDLQHHLTTMVDPQVLRSVGINVSRAVQRPNEFIVTFPEAYHSGFNTGLNLAEAVNVAFASWLPHGVAACKNYAQVRRPSVLCLKELALRILMTAVESGTNLAYPGADTCIEILRETLNLIDDLKARGLPLLEQSSNMQNDNCSLCNQIISFAHCPTANDGNLCLDCATRYGTATSIHFRYQYEPVKYILLRALSTTPTSTQPPSIEEPAVAAPVTPKRRGRPRKDSYPTPPKVFAVPSSSSTLSPNRRSNRLKRPRTE